MRLKSIIASTLALFALCTASAQAPKCHTDEAHHQLLNSNPGLMQQLQANEIAVREWIQNNRKGQHRGTSTLVTIPVVFHIVYKNNTQNIADSNVIRQVDILNECYRLQNTNFSQTRAIFDTIAADVEVEFCLASVDPAGNPTNGITRTQAPSSAFFDPLLGFDNVKRSANGGKDPWPAHQYLNIWICDMSLFGLTAVLGYAQFPGGDPLTDGVVIQYQFTGFMPNNTTNNKGKTTVHEVGHWLGLRHIWGDGQGSSTPCDSSDYVDDTPNADTASQQTCIIKNSCSNESAYWTNIGIDPPDMIENYMDYSYDDCMTMFSMGQKDRMLGFLNTVRTSILTSPGCGNTGIAEAATSSLTLYPNPTCDQIQIETIYSNSIRIEITDLSGKVWMQADDAKSLDVSALPQGVYMVKALLDNGKNRTLKFVKN